MLITQFALQIEYRVEYYVKDLFKDNEQFKTLQEFSDVLSRKSNWLCEYKILKTVTFKKSLSFDMTCCSYLQSILKT